MANSELAHGERQALEWLARGSKAEGLKTSGLAKLKGPNQRKVLLADLLWRQAVAA